MAVHLDARYVSTTKPISRKQCEGHQGKFTSITGPNGLMKVGMREEGIANKAFSFLKEAYSDPVVYLPTALFLGCGSIAFFCAGGPVGLGLGLAMALALIAYIAICDPLSRAEDSAEDSPEVKEVDKQEVKRVKALFDESFKYCKKASETIEKAQRLLHQNRGSSKIFVNLDRNESNEQNVSFGAYCSSSRGLISLLYPNIDASVDFDCSQKQELLHAVLFESINLARSYTKPDLLKKASAQVDHSINDYARNKKIKCYAKEMEKWEFGTLLEVIEVYRKIIAEVDLGAPCVRDSQKQFWKSTALAVIKGYYAVFLYEAREKLNNNKSEAAFTKSEAAFTLRGAQVDTLEKVDEILNEIEPNPDTRSERFRKLIKIKMKEKRHTQYYEECFRSWLPAVPTPKTNLL